MSRFACLTRVQSKYIFQLNIRTKLNITIFFFTYFCCLFNTINKSGGIIKCSLFLTAPFQHAIQYYFHGARNFSATRNSFSERIINNFYPKVLFVFAFEKIKNEKSCVSHCFGLNQYESLFCLDI